MHILGIIPLLTGYMIRVDNLSVSYGNIAALIGANGAGKTTLLKAISGLVPYSGDIFLNEQPLKGKESHLIVGLGIVYVPEGRGIFSNLSVKENLILSS